MNKVKPILLKDGRREEQRYRSQWFLCNFCDLAVQCAVAIQGKAWNSESHRRNLNVISHTGSLFAYMESRFVDSFHRLDVFYILHAKTCDLSLKVWTFQLRHMSMCISLPLSPIPEVFKLWGASSRQATVGTLGGELISWGTFILNEIWAQDRIHILVGTLLGWSILFIA
jgi:hypothetical protein